MANALEMVRRCGRYQTGERPAEWALRETRSSEAGVAACQEYLPEAEMGDAAAPPLPDAETGGWA